MNAYVGGVSALGFLGLVLTVLRNPWSSSLSQAVVGPVVFLCIAAVVGENRPLLIARGDQDETISTSAPFILALVAVAGVGVAVLAQAVASVGDDLVNRRPPKKSIFNTAQYTLSVLAARAVFARLSHEPFFGGPISMSTEHLAPLLIGGLAMVAVNRLLVGTVVAIAMRQPLRAILFDAIAFHGITQVVLLSIGGVAAIVADDGVAALSLLAAPVVAVYITAAAAIRHAHQASHDSLTGLGNRDRLYKQLAEGLGSPRGTSGTGLVLLDLDHFKDINDTLGHPVGDQLLRQVADRLTGVSGESIAHRLGGDEFAVIVDGGLEASQSMARLLLAALQEPMRVGEVELLVRASAGVAVSPEHGLDAHTLMKNADIALYQAKLERDGICTYSEEFDVNTLERLQVLADLRSAIDVGQLEVAYQPQVDLNDGRIVGVEALVRWEHPTRGTMAPDTFVPLAENSGLIGEITALVLREALTTLAGWRAVGHDLRIAVNLSARHLSDIALPGQVADALLTSGVPAEALVLEVTETGILSDPARVDVVMAALRSLGVSIAVDDYGTGHASLSYLKRLEVDELKVDKSFVSDMGRDHHDFVIVRSTIALARDLGLRVIAEGIEDAPTAAALREMGCGIGQGYHLGRPMSAPSLLEHLDAQRRIEVLAAGGAI
ncbi:MAG TPA: EAL domain-containing protein [Actinotalea sp.]